MRHSLRLLPVTGIAIILAGCFGSAPSPTASVATPPASQPGASASAGQPSASSDASAEPMPSEDLGPFSCDLPIHVDATTPRANITDVRVGTHATYDRVVFEFTDGVPEASLERAEPPFTQDASGAPIDVEGSSVLRLILRGGTKQTEDGTSSYDGPLDFDPAFPTLVDLIEGGDFEAQSTWYLGLTSEACVRVITLTDDGAPRLVIDVEH
ncbi:MAG TPA: hypothetical protein VFW95_07050 [Candidatus Limnocylindria bacterium]|nr:hypothetical protein [Candidatus Limnocylindria bacterium]